MSQVVVKVKKESIVSCMTCSICLKLFTDATTISECLHTFCRKCIYEKLADEEVDCCPKCNMYLGCAPLEKLSCRPDHNLQDLRAKIFSFEKKKDNEVDYSPSISLPPRRKERSLSSLVVITPQVSAQTGLTRKRTKALARRTASRGSSIGVEEPKEKEDCHLSDPGENSSSPETLTRIAQNRRKSSSSAAPSNDCSPNKAKDNGAEPWAGEIDLLNFLVDAANKTQSSKYNSQGSVVESEPKNALQNAIHVPKTKAKKVLLRSEANADNNGTLDSTGLVNPKKPQRMGRKKKPALKDVRISAQAVVDSAGAKRDRRINPIWLTLVASDERVGSAPLPQVSPGYLRIKDGNTSVSSVQKYLATKLSLTNEAEVEITCQGQPVVPTMQLCDLIDVYLQTTPSITEKVQTTVGTSAKEFVMVLGYAPKIQIP
ncbi:hypothetical protein GIB67_027143 [Kingdonia uniflora]|uniref:RING-type domain-containing protein n=1 Tax=Kingdonia uniflora TaxID=39325 RepID=A0A7J7P2Q1_9MAGN|nr:hypothetical protein GIB67_027143 [Kingdonia uniflora]